MERVRILEDGCWEWLGARHEKGYAVASVDGHAQRVPRVLWRIFNGPIPPGHVVCHRCDRPSCVNPQHFFLGLPKDNAVDMMAKGRHRYVAHRGEEHGMAKLTDEQAEEIRRRYAAGGVKQRELAAEFGVTQAAVSYVILHRRGK